MSLNIKTGYEALLEQANSEVSALSAEEAVTLSQNPNYVFVDLRDPRELKREGKIPGAFHCPRGMLEFWIDPQSPYAKPIFQEEKTFVFYCASGWRSALSAKTAQDMGLSPVRHIAGGLTAWKATNGPVEIPE